jgi:type IV secretion system protein TrbL
MLCVVDGSSKTLHALGAGRSLGVFLASIMFALIVSMLLAGDAFAQQASCPVEDGNNILDCVLGTFQRASAQWETRLLEFATRLFWILALIEFTWAAAQLALRGADISEWSASLVNQVLFIGFFSFLLTHSAEFARAVVNSFREAANAASGTTLLRPSDIFDVGVNLASSVLSGGSLWNLPHSLVLAFAAFFLIIAFGLIAASLIVALVESFIVISAGVLFMGFGGSRWTKDYAVRTFQYCLSVGAKLFVIQLLAGLLVAIVQPWAAVAANNSSLSTASMTSILVLSGVSLIFATISRVIPDMVQALVNGTSLANGSGLYGSVGNVATGAAVAAASGGMAVTSAARLAQEQLRAADIAGTGPTTSLGRAARLARSTAANIAGAGIENVGDRLGGKVPPRGSRMGQMSLAMSAERRELARKNVVKASGASTSDPQGSGTP